MKLGFIVNPVAGIGGRVGLKGSDGLDIQKKAMALGAIPEASLRASQALQQLSPLRDDLKILCYPGEMGEETARSCSNSPVVLGSIQKSETTAEDTRNAAREMLERKVDLLLFAGGDGTARDIYTVVGERLTSLGIPAGVKIHSAVFATHPASAGELALRFLQGGVPCKEAEVMDIDEESFRKGLVSAKLFGYLRVPFHRNLTQGVKSASILSERASLKNIAAVVIRRMQTDYLYIIGPGTTTRAITDMLGLPKTLLGVDVIQNMKLIASDAGERDLLNLLENHDMQRNPAYVVVTPIGGQGFIFGRGNQQISPAVLKKVGKDRILVISTTEKVHSLEGQPFLVDTGDRNLDKDLSGFIRVITGYNEEIVYRISSE